MPVEHSRSSARTSAARSVTARLGKSSKSSPSSFHARMAKRMSTWSCTCRCRLYPPLARSLRVSLKFLQERSSGFVVVAHKLMTSPSSKVNADATHTLLTPYTLCSSACESVAWDPGMPSQLKSDTAVDVARANPASMTESMSSLSPHSLSRQAPPLSSPRPPSHPPPLPLHTALHRSGAETCTPVASLSLK